MHIYDLILMKMTINCGQWPDEYECDGFELIIQIFLNITWFLKKHKSLCIPTIQESYPRAWSGKQHDSSPCANGLDDIKTSICSIISIGLQRMY